jgi:hypothetical protein
MKRNLIIVILVLTILGCSENEKLGQAVISEINSYDKEDLYFPHDCKMEEYELVDKMFELKKNGENIIISNNANDGFTGHYLTLKLNSNLEIINAEYSESTDVIDGSETTFKVDSVNLKLNSNPFNSKKIIGYYSIYLTQNYFAGELKEQRVKDEIIKREFKGKFKTCEE